MNYFTRKNFITALIVVLLVINVTALITFVVRPGFIFRRDEMKCCPHRHPREFLKEELNLTDEQNTAFDILRENHHDTLNAIGRHMNEMRRLINTEMMKATPDSALLFSTTDELGRLYASVRKLNIVHYWKMKSLCNELQKQKLDSVFFRIFSCDDWNAGRCAKPSDSGCRMHNKHRAEIHKGKHGDDQNENIF